ncbi:hypothetical protein C8R45DRAFT_939657 [Mycena sanguinolenta]|nr:hypothetical protein C8R45DRAFT_939657 [Mycena sanguinolenta]
MGYVKGRFCSLRGLREQIDDNAGHERALAWVKACLVIHTLIGFIEAGHEDFEFMEELLQEGRADPPTADVDEEIVAEARRKTRGQKKRLDLKAKLFANGVVEDREL